MSGRAGRGRGERGGAGQDETTRKPEGWGGCRHLALVEPPSVRRARAGPSLPERATRDAMGRSSRLQHGDFPLPPWRGWSSPRDVGRGVHPGGPEGLT